MGIGKKEKHFLLNCDAYNCIHEGAKIEISSFDVFDVNMYFSNVFWFVLSCSFRVRLAASKWAQDAPGTTQDSPRTSPRPPKRIQKLSPSSTAQFLIRNLLLLRERGTFGEYKS